MRGRAVTTHADELERAYMRDCVEVAEERHAGVAFQILQYWMRAKLG